MCYLHRLSQINRRHAPNPPSFGKHGAINIDPHPGAATFSHNYTKKLKWVC